MAGDRFDGCLHSWRSRLVTEFGWERPDADLERDIVTRSEVGLLFDDDCFRFELGWRRDNTRVRPTGPSEGVYVRLNLATFGGSGYDRNDMR